MCLLISVLLAPETKPANRKCLIKEVSANAFHFFPSLCVDLFTSFCFNSHVVLFESRGFFLFKSPFVLYNRERHLKYLAFQIAKGDLIRCS